MFLPALSSTDSVFFFRDISQNHRPYRHLTMEMIGDGQAPVWNPLRGAGQPLLANPNSLLLHPTTLLFLIASIDTALKLSVILQIFIAAAGMWLLLRDLGAGRAASLVGAAIFALSGYMLSLGNLLNLLDSAAFMPWTVLFAGRCLTRRFRPWGGLAAASLAVQLLAGEPALLLCTAAGLVSLHLSYPRLPGQLPAKTMRAGAVLALAAALSMVGLLPTVELVSLSERGVGFDPQESMKWSQPPVALLDMVFPDFLGDPTRPDPSRYWGGPVFDAGLPLILSTYVGPLALLLAAMGLWTSARSRRVQLPEALSLCALGAAGVILSLGRHLPVYPALLAVAPSLGSARYPVKYMILVVWAVAILPPGGPTGSSTPTPIGPGAHRRGRRGSVWWQARGWRPSMCWPEGCWDAPTAGTPSRRRAGRGCSPPGDCSWCSRRPGPSWQAAGPAWPSSSFCRCSISACMCDT